jgi:hypothetical protein
VVVGGKYQGLAIVHSLGRPGVLVSVVDDGHSIFRFSGDCKQFVRRSDLRDELSMIDNLLTLGTRLNPTQLRHIVSGIFLNIRHDDSLSHVAGSWRIESLKPTMEIVSVGIKPGLAMSEREDGREHSNHSH